MRYRLRTLVLLVTTLGVLLGGVTWCWRRAEQQRIAVARMKSLGNGVYYRRQGTKSTHQDANESNRLSWLPIDWYDSVTDVFIDNASTPEDRSLPDSLGNLRALEGLHFGHVLDESRRDECADWKPLEKLRRLRSVTLPDYDMITLIDGNCPLEEASFVCRDSMNAKQARSLARFVGLKSITNLVSRREAIAPLSTLSQLERLGLDGSEISGEPITFLARLQNLKWLSLARTDIVDRDLLAVSQLTQLEELNLENTAISDAGLANLRALPKLKSSSLGGCKLSGEGLSSLLGIASLTQVNLTNSGDLRESNVESFQAKRPDVGVWVIKLPAEPSE